MSNDVGPSPRAILGVEFPICKLEDFEKFEKSIDPKNEENAANPDAALQKQEALKRIMKSIVQGTMHFDRDVKHILGELTTADVQEHYSGIGRKRNGIGKRNFSLTLVFACMKDVLEKKYAEKSKQLNFVTVTSEYLAGFGSRDGRRAKRKREADE
ncbi:uncharacterized protein LOC107046735 [Diachasma alloeum]|nr:uncharacterized protein LOC107046735 [Diachasma alloeum]